jgi:hypothetical protein
MNGFLHKISTMPVILAVCCSLSAQQDVAEKPKALLAAECARSALKSGTIEWVSLSEGDETRFRRHISRYASNGDFIYEQRGDQGGWTVQHLLKYPLLYLRNGAGWWKTQETSLGARFWSEDGHLPEWAGEIKDFRLAGIGPVTKSLDVCEAHHSYGLPDRSIARWREWKDGATHLVTGVLTDGGAITWRIDPARGWNAERVTLQSADGVTVAESVSVLREFDGVWLPERTDYFLNGKLRESVRLTRAALNRKADARSFALADLGCEPGTNIGVENSPARAERGLDFVKIWDGETVIESNDWFRMVKEGKRRPGPTFERLNRGEPFTSPYESPLEAAAKSIETKKSAARGVLEAHRGLWEKYVLDFIARFRLHEEQVQQAYQILARCQRAAEERTQRERSAFIPLWTERQSAGERFDDRKAAELERLAEKIEGTVERIFKEELQPRLEKIPTRAQRKAAEEAGATTAPAKKD